VRPCSAVDRERPPPYGGKHAVRKDAHAVRKDAHAVRRCPRRTGGCTPYGGARVVRRDAHAARRGTVAWRGATAPGGRTCTPCGEAHSPAERRTADGAPDAAQQTAPLVWGAVAALPAGLPSVHQIILGTGQARPDVASRGSAARGCPAAVPGQLVRATFLCRILADGNP
jgi:hypothetical protein